MSKKSLLNLIDEKIVEAKAAAERGEKPKTKLSTRSAINKANAPKSTGPKSKEGKAASAANSWKHGFFANIDRLDPADAPTYQNLLADFRQGMHPDGPIEDLCCRELAMLQTRLQRLESIEFALIMGNIDGPPATNPDVSPGRQSGGSPALYLRDEFNGDAPIDYAIDSRDLAQAFTAAGDALDRLHKIETHLRRAYNRTFDRLQRLQRDHLKKPPSTPSDRPPRHPRPDYWDVAPGNLSERTQSPPSPGKQTPKATVQPALPPAPDALKPPQHAAAPYAPNSPAARPPTSPEPPAFPMGKGAAPTFGNGAFGRNTAGF